MPPIDTGYVAFYPRLTFRYKNRSLTQYRL